MAKELKKLLFNKKTGVLLGDIPTTQDTSKLNLEKFVTKEVEIDPIAEFWDGDYQTGSVKTVDMTTRFTEATVNEEITAEIEEKYDLVAQLRYIREAIKSIGADKLPKEFLDMCDHIDDCVAKGKTKKATYKESDAYDYMSEEDIKNRSASAIDFN